MSIEKRCEYCWGTYHCRDPRSKYCSATCNTRAYDFRKNPAHWVNHRAQYRLASVKARIKWNQVLVNHTTPDSEI